MCLLLLQPRCEGLILGQVLLPRPRHPAGDLKRAVHHLCVPVDCVEAFPYHIVHLGEALVRAKQVEPPLKLAQARGASGTRWVGGRRGLPRSERETAW